MRIRIETKGSIVCTGEIDKTIARKEMRRMCDEVTKKDFIEVINDDGNLTLISTKCIENITLI